MTDYKQLMAELDEVLKSGPRTTDKLAAMFPDYPRWQLNNVIGYLGCIRQGTGRPHTPSLIFHPKDPNAPRPAIDVWLKERLAKHPVASTLIIQEAKEQGYAKSVLEQSLTRLGVTSQRLGARWFKCLPGQVVDPDPIELSASALNVGTTMVAGFLLGEPTFSAVLAKSKDHAQSDAPSHVVNAHVRGYLNHGAAHGLFTYKDGTYGLTPLGQAVAEYALDMTWEPGMSIADVEAEAER